MRRWQRSCIGKGCRDCEELLHDRPEPFFRVPVEFAVFKRKDAGETAQDKYRGREPFTGGSPREQYGICGDEPVIYENSYVLEIKAAVAGTLICDLVLMVDTGTFDCLVLLLVPAPEAAGA